MIVYFNNNRGKHYVDFKQIGEITVKSMIVLNYKGEKMPKYGIEK